MRTTALLALRAVLAVSLVGSLLVQVLLMPLLWADLREAPVSVRVPLVVILVLGIVCLQVVAVCIWQLLTMVRRGTVFSRAPFRYIDVMAGAIATASALALGVAVVARHANHQVTGDAVAPGLVALVCGASLVIAGVALIVLVLRALLAQAVALDSRAKHLQTELDGVV